MKALLRRRSRRRSLARQQPPRSQFLECLEARHMMAAEDVITVGRMLSAWTTADVVNNQLKITYSVYNQQDKAVSGLLLTTTLQPDVEFVNASILPNQNGQELAWSLGTLAAFGRASIEVTVAFDGAIPLQLDDGAEAFGTLNARAVFDDAPAAMLRSDPIDASLLASTPEANANDPFIQAKAAQLDYDPNLIFEYLTQDIAYESYRGSSRGARGTLWSTAGNSLDEASLGVALMRASGIPARYAFGDLSDAFSKQLILSMFPESFKTIGYLPPGTQTADPVNDTNLLAETSEHYWLQFDVGGGFVNADTAFSGATLGQTFTAADGTFAEVPDALRHKTTIRLNAEITNTATGLFGLPGQSLATVLEHTFIDAALVGRPLTIGHFVSTSNVAAPAFSMTTHNYSPYIREGDLASDASTDNLIRGTDYQEVLTNFPFGSTIFTGLFLEITLSAPGVADEHYSRTLYDRIGYDVRQGLNSPNVSIDPSDGPAITLFDAFTVNVLPGRIDGNTNSALATHLNGLVQQIEAMRNSSGVLPPEAMPLVSQFFVEMTRLHGVNFFRGSDLWTDSMADAGLVKAYFDRPRIAIVSHLLEEDAGAGESLSSKFSMDLRRNTIRALAAPGQIITAAASFQFSRGILESEIEGAVLALDDSASSTSSPYVTTMKVMQAAFEQNIAIATLSSLTIAKLDALQISAEAKARITTALQKDHVVMVPSQPVELDGESVTAWYELDPVTGEVIGVGENGEHNAIVQYVAVLSLGSFLAGALLVDLALLSIPFLPDGEENYTAYKYAIGTGGLAFAGAVFGNSIKALAEVPVKTPGTYLGVGLAFAFLAGAGSMFALAVAVDPPADSGLSKPSGPPEFSEAQGEQTVTADSTGGTVNGSVNTQSAKAEGLIAASWTAAGANVFNVTTLEAANATVRNAEGAIIGTGTIGLNPNSRVSIVVDSAADIALSGTGSLSSYAEATGGLGISGEWSSYSANLSSDVELVIETGSLLLNGVLLSAGSYRISSSAATIGGSGQMASQSFAGSLSIDLVGGTVNIGPSNGSFSIGGQATGITQGVTLSGFSGELDFVAGAGIDSLNIQGAAIHSLRLSTNSAPLTTDQNTPVFFQPQIHTTLSGDYELSAEAPKGWGVSISDAGVIRLQPKAGLQGGTYPVIVTARSSSTLELVAHLIVDVTITPTAPGVELSLEADSLLTVPYEGAQLPTAFRAIIHNPGPATNAYDLTFSNVPPGFSVVSSAPSATIPSGETGFIGFYLVPNPGQQLPAPGTQLSFIVTATSTSNPSITESHSVDITVPDIHAIALSGNPIKATTTPGTGIEAELVIVARGNVPETVSFTVDPSAGLSVEGVQQVTLNPGEEVVLQITLTPSAEVPLNSTLVAKITASFGGNEPVILSIPVFVAAPGVEAISQAATSARELGESELAERLEDLSIALTNLTQNPLNNVFKSQALASLDSILSLLTVDPLLKDFVGPLTSARAELAAADAPPEIQSAIQSLGAALDGFAEVVGALARSNMQVYLTPNTQVAQPLVPQQFTVVVQNIGTQQSTYNLTVGTLPSGVTSQFSDTQVTLNPGEFANVTLTLTQSNNDELAAFNFQVDVSIDGVTPAITKSVNGSLTVRSEYVTVVDVQTDVSFTNPGGVVGVTTRLLNAVNRRQDALVSFEVFNSNGDSVFTSTPVATQLTVQTTLADVDLGTFNTTGYPLGNYRIVVTVTDDLGTPIPGATGETVLLVGTPVKATLDISQNDLLPGTRTITNTLQIDSSTPLGDAFDLIGQATSAGSTNSIRHGDYVYVATSSGMQVFNIGGVNINNPQLVRTVGQATFTLQIRGDMLVTASAGHSSRIDIYSLTDPSDPQLLGSTGVFPYGSASSMVITDTHVFVVMINVIYWLGSNDVFDMNGAVVAINIEDPTTPYLDGDAITAQGTAAGRDGVNDGVLFNDNGTNTDGVKVIGGIDQSGGNHNTWDIKQVSPTIVLVTGSSATGTDTQAGVGQVYVVDISDPSNLTVLRTLDIPGTVHAFGLAIDGDLALLTATEGGLQDFAFGNPFSGRAVLATLDISDPENPSIIDTKVIDDLARGVTFPAALGNGLFAMGTDGTDTGSKIYLIDATDPENLFLAVNDAPPMRPVASYGGDNLILTTDGSSLIIYQAQATPAIPVTAQVQIPNGTGVTIVPGSFNIPPTQIIAGVGFDTLVWDLALTAGNDSITITWDTTVANIKPAESREITLDTTIDFAENGTPGQIVLPPQTVAARHIIEIVPDEQTLQPGQTGIYGVSLSNPTNSSVTYNLSVAGIPQEWINLVSEVTLPAFGFVNLPMFVAPDLFAVLGDYGFVVTATAAGGSDSVQGLVTLEGEPIVPLVDPVAHGVVVDLTPIGAVAGQGTAANYVVRLTNTGSEAETFNLSLTGLPIGYTVTFAQSSVIVPPGASNYRDIALTILVPAGATTGDHVFNIATFSIDSGVSDDVFGLVNVSAIGVDVEFMPNSGTPGSTFNLKVTNNSTTTQTFDLSLAGPAALVASLGVNSVTLGPGAFQMVSINVGALNFAYPGALDLVAIASSQTNTAVQDADRASVNIAGRLGLSAAFEDDSIQLNSPGQTMFTLLIENLGNLEDQYVAEIFNPTGPITASLIGLDGQPTQSIPVFILPGLSKAAILLNVNLGSLLPATVSVRIRSLTDNSIVAQDTARIIVPIPDDIGDVIVLGSVGGNDVRTRVKVIDPTNDAVIVTFTPYGNSFHGGVRVATADLDKDGVLEIITAPGPGRDPLVKVFDLEGHELPEYRIKAYSNSFTGGVYVAVGDVDGDGYLDIITTPGGDMAAEVRVWRNRLNKGATYEDDVFSSKAYRSFLAFGSSFHGGATVAADDLTGDNKAEVVVGNGPGIGPRVRAFDLTKFKQTSTPKLAKHLLEIRPFATTDRGGVFVAAGMIRGDTSKIIVGNGINGRGEVEIYRNNGTFQDEFVPYPSGNLNAPVHVSRKNYDGGRLFEILTSQGSPGSSLNWRVWEYDADLVDEAMEEDPDFINGFFVA